METYNLKLIGSVDDISSCRRIMLYNSFDGYSNLTAQNYSQVLALLKKSEDYLISEKTFIDNKYVFPYNRSNGRIFGFNNIIFLGENDKVLGFKYYSEIQGRNLNYNIEVIVNKGVDTVTTYIGELEVSLTGLEESSTSLNSQFLGESLSNYTSSKRVFSDISEKKKKGIFTSSIYDVMNNSNRVISIGNKNTIYQLDNKLNYTIPNIINNLRYDTHEVGYNRFSVGYYGFSHDLVLYEWKKVAILKKDSTEIDYYTDYFNIISLTNLNKFSDPISYLKRKTNCDTSEGCISGGWYLPKYESDNFEKSEILYTSGKYIVGKIYYTDGTSEIKLFNSENVNEWTSTSMEESGFWDNEFGENLDNKRILLDEHSGCPEIINLGDVDKSLVYSKVVEKLPELVNNFTNFRDFFNRYSNSLNIIKKIGNWFLFNYNDQSNINIYRLSGIYGDLILSEEDIPNIIIIDSMNILLKEEKYYVLYNITYTDNKVLSTERARKLLEGGMITEDTNLLGFSFSMSKGGGNDKVYEDYYKQGVIEIIPKTQNLYKTSLNKFRKNFYPNTVGMPDIICACDGYIFYLINNKINYL